MDEKILQYLIIYELRRKNIVSRKSMSRLIQSGFCELKPERTAILEFSETLTAEEDRESLTPVLNNWSTLLRAAEETRMNCLQWGIGVTSVTEADYPSLLAECRDAPFVLFYKGSLRQPEPTPNYLAIVGSRKMTSYGSRFLENVLPPVLAYQTVVISGLARGVDTKAHEVCLKHGGFTIACLAHGLDLCYPPEHRPMRDRIIAEGLLLSEHAPGVEAKKSYFPARNRLISGLSQAVLVVEAGIKSGSLITTEFAAAQGREVLAVPGSIYQPSSEGANRLIRDGATPVLDFSDILYALGIDAVSVMLNRKVYSDPLLKELAKAPLSETELQQLLNTDIRELRIELVKKEAEGLIKRSGGRFFLTSA